MIRTTFIERRRLESLDPAMLAEHQIARLNNLLEQILPHNGFYADKLAGVKLPVASLEQLDDLPYTFKEELVSGALDGRFAPNLTYPRDHYVRYHRTSGTRGRPMVVLDTAQDWLWWIDTWQFILDVVEVSPSDRVLAAFSLRPFIGF